jgi:hypothetical protein
VLERSNECTKRILSQDEDLAWLQHSLFGTILPSAILQLNVVDTITVPIASYIVPLLVEVFANVDKVLLKLGLYEEYRAVLTTQYENQSAIELWYLSLVFVLTNSA